jgi:peptidoglycan-associated lipoprotein
MKMNQLIFPLVLALAATLTTTGCKKGTPKLTALPGTRAAQVGGDFNPNTLPNANPIIENGNLPGTGANATRGGGNTSDFNLDDFNQDRAALAANTVHFAFDSAVVKQGEESNIAAVATALGANAADKLLIEGHCDERGTEEYNRALGERRALALREALAKAGVSPDRIRTISYGKDKPVNPGHDDSAWTQNRRGEFILLHPKAGV